MRLGRRLFFLYAVLGALFGVRLLLTTIHIGEIEREAEGVIEEDARFMALLADLRQTMKEAIESSRLAALDPKEAERAEGRRRAVAAILGVIAAEARPEERELVEALAGAWREAEAGFEEIRARPRRADRIFSEKVLPALAEAGDARAAIESARRGHSIERVREIRETVRTTRSEVMLFVFFAFVVFVGVYAVLRRRVLAPTARLVAATERIASGDLSHRVGYRSDDEIGTLAERFDAMAERLSQAERARMEFLSMVSHEMRTPLTAIGGYLSLLRRGLRGPLSPRQAEAVETIAREAERLAALVEDLLDAARAEAGAFRVEPVEAEPDKVLREAVAPLAVRAEEAGIAWLVEIGKMPRAVLDPRRLAQAVRNLVTNALKFTPRGGRVSVRAFSREGTLFVEVEDTGPRIPDEALPGLFTRFYQVPSIRDAERAGTGLGLAIVREICRAHGGDITLAQHEDRKTFVLAIPLRPPADDTPRARARGAPSPDSAPARGFPATGGGLP